MANTTRRCRVCRKYRPRENFGRAGVCSASCEEALRQEKIAVRSTWKGNVTDPVVHSAVLERDGYRCRMCGSGRHLHVHHITYRSEGGPDTLWNLVTLCGSRCHGRVHSDKTRWQPILRAVIWKFYVEGVSVTVPQMERWLRAAAA